MATTLSPGCLQQRLTSRTPRGRSRLTVQAAKAKAGGPGKQRLDATGYVVDNSDKGNIFAIMPRQLYTSSPTADRAARQGLGGMQGLLVLAVVLGAVGLATLGVAGNSPDSLQAVASQSEDSLSAIAQRVSSSL